MFATRPYQYQLRQALGATNYQPGSSGGTTYQLGLRCHFRRLAHSLGAEGEVARVARIEREAARHRAALARLLALLARVGEENNASLEA